MMFVIAAANAAHVANTIVASAPDAAKWTDVGIFVATALLAIVTGFLFYATYLVARRTYDLGVDTLRGNALADVHHQQSLNPMLVVKHPGKCTWDEHTLMVYVKNIGLGPAIDCRLEVTHYGGRPAKSTPVKFGSIGNLEQGPSEGIDIRFVPDDIRQPKDTSIVYTLRCKTFFNHVHVTTWKGTRVDGVPNAAEMIAHRMASYSPTRIPDGPKPKTTVLNKVLLAIRLRH